MKFTLGGTSMQTVKDRFLDYIAYHTTSDDTSSTCPSTQTQLNFGKHLAEECRVIGLKNTAIDQYGYVTAFLPSNCSHYVPAIGFLAHMDTSPDAPGNHVIPIITENYQGSEIKLKGITLSPAEFPELNLYLGETIITSDGTTLLGADDKAGIAEIITAMEYLASHPEIKHGPIHIAFTPDEEIGKGADHFDVPAFGAEFAYTVDGGRLGELEYENFHAARVNITIQGKSVHPGTAKGIMKNAALIGTEFASLLPPTETPAYTENREGFFHLISFTGTVSEAKLSYLIRDFDQNSFQQRKQCIQNHVDFLNKKYGNIIALECHDEYRNMFSVIEKKKYIIDLAIHAMEECGISPLIQPIRGGTDGARLSFMGLPCPNLFAGGHNFHGPYEFIPVSSMEKAVHVIVKIAELASQQKF